MGKLNFDLLVIGAGPGGYAAAIRAAQLGLKVACAEQEPALGGTCLRVGCIPSKVLLESSHKLVDARGALARHGVKVGAVELDLAAVLKRKESVVSTLTKGIEALFAKNKVTRLTGQARFEGPGCVRVSQAGSELLVRAPRVIIATGSKPGALSGVELDGEGVVTSTESLSFAEVPKHLVVIGAGYIGLELSCVWQRFGARVTVLEYLNRILPGMDAEIASEAQRIFTRQGLEFRLGARVLSARRQDGSCVVECDGAAPIECDRVLLAAGRVPNTDDLGLESVGVQLDERGRIPVDEHFATAAKGVFAVGDVIDGPMLAHKAEAEGVACAEWLATGQGHARLWVIPGVVFTHPEIASVGCTEAELQQQGAAYRKGVFPFLACGRARALGATEGRAKVLADAQTDRVLGVHILGAQAGELIAVATTAMSLGATSRQLGEVCQAHPTLAEALKEAALAVRGAAVHG